MAVEVTLGSILPAPVPTDGWIVGYRIKGTIGAYITPSGSPFMAQPIVFSTTDPAGTLYEGFIKGDCGALESTNFLWTTPCDCPATYTPSPDGSYCQKEDTTAATVTNSGYCLVASTNGNYTQYESRVYGASFDDNDLILPAGTLGGNIAARMTTTPQWCNPGFSTTIGPMNREAVWIDSDCDTVKDALAPGVVATIGFIFNNLGATRTIYLGVAGDNQFQVKVNGAIIASGLGSYAEYFKIWHLIPIVINPGVNYFNVLGTGDGTINDAVAAVLYDNTSAELQAATSDAELTVIFKSSDLRGTTFDVATCPNGYSLDTSGGSGSYICVTTLTDICNGLP